MAWVCQYLSIRLPKDILVPSRFGNYEERCSYTPLVQVLVCMWIFQLLWLNNKEWDCWIVVTFGFVRNHQTVPLCTSTISEWSSCCPTALVFLLIPDIMYCSQPTDGYAFTEWLGTWGCCFRSRVSKHLKQESPSAPRGFGALWKAAVTWQSSVSPGSGQGTRPSRALPPRSLSF